MAVPVSKRFTRIAFPRAFTQPICAAPGRRDFMKKQRVEDRNAVLRNLKNTRFRNWVFLLSFVGWAITLTSHGEVQSDAAREFRLLMEQHEKAVAAAVDPVNRRQVAALDALLRRVNQANDPTTAAKIRTELLKLGVTAPGGPSISGAPGSEESRRAALRIQLRDTRWSLGGDKTFTLNADGTTTASWHTKRGTWKVTAPDKAELVITNSSMIHVVTFNGDLTMGSMAGEKGDMQGTAQRMPGVIAKSGP